MFFPNNFNMLLKKKKSDKQNMAALIPQRPACLL